MNPEENPIDQDVLDYAHRMFDLARNGMTDDLVLEIEAGLPVNLTNDKGDTLLMLAAYGPHPRTVEQLLQRGADHSRINDRGQTALGCAAFRKSPPTMQVLLDAGADPDLGGQSARAVVQFFDLGEEAALLASAAPNSES